MSRTYNKRPSLAKHQRGKVRDGKLREHRAKKRGERQRAMKEADNDREEYCPFCGGIIIQRYVGVDGGHRLFPILYFDM